jgi:hypothetical protein
MPAFDENPHSGDLGQPVPPTLEAQIPEIVRLVNAERKKEVYHAH